jgi:hypothetical protein
MDGIAEAAAELAFLVLGPALDRAMFDGRRETNALARAADDGVRMFLAVYGGG